MAIGIPSELVERAAVFKGNGHHLEAALGAYVLGQLYGWRVLNMLHGVQIMRRHEKVLGLDLRQALPDRTSLSDRVLGIRVADTLSSYWRVAKGELAGRERFNMTDTDQGSLL